MVEKPSSPNADELLGIHWESNMSPEQLMSRSVELGELATELGNAAGTGVSKAFLLSCKGTGVLVDAMAESWTKYFTQVGQIATQVAAAGASVSAWATTLSAALSAMASVVADAEIEIKALEASRPVLALSGQSPDQAIEEVKNAAKARIASISSGAAFAMPPGFPPVGAPPVAAGMGSKKPTSAGRTSGDKPSVGSAAGMGLKKPTSAGRSTEDFAQPVSSKTVSAGESSGSGGGQLSPVNAGSSNGSAGGGHGGGGSSSSGGGGGAGHGGSASSAAGGSGSSSAAGSGMGSSGGGHSGSGANPSHAGSSSANGGGAHSGSNSASSAAPLSNTPAAHAAPVSGVAPLGAIVGPAASAASSVASGAAAAGPGIASGAAAATGAAVTPAVNAAGLAAGQASAVSAPGPQITPTSPVSPALQPPPPVAPTAGPTQMAATAGGGGGPAAASAPSTPPASSPAPTPPPSASHVPPSAGVVGSGQVPLGSGFVPPIVPHADPGVSAMGVVGAPLAEGAAAMLDPELSAVRSVLEGAGGGGQVHWAAGMFVTGGRKQLVVTTDRGRSWMPPQVRLPADVVLPWNHPQARLWEGLNDPVRVLLEWGAAQEGGEFTALSGSRASASESLTVAPFTVANIGADPRESKGADNRVPRSYFGVPQDARSEAELITGDRAKREQALWAAIDAVRRVGLGGPAAYIVEAMHADPQLLLPGRAIDLPWGSLEAEHDRLMQYEIQARRDMRTVPLGRIDEEPSIDSRRALVHLYAMESVLGLRQISPDQVLADALYSWSMQKAELKVAGEAVSAA